MPKSLNHFIAEILGRYIVHPVIRIFRQHVVADSLGIATRTVDISSAVDGYLEEHEPDAAPTRRGNVMARQRMIVLFDQSASLRALPIGTGNKSERLLGYFTWHADDSPPINPLGDLYKTQVWTLARHLGLPSEVVDKPAVGTAGGQQLRRRALLRHASGIEHDHAIGARRQPQPVGDEQHRPPLHQPLQRLGDGSLAGFVLV